MTALEQLDPLYHFSTHYPDRLNLIDSSLTVNTLTENKLHKSRSNRRKNHARYKTQPITFDEIKEVEEPDTAASADDENTPNSMDLLFNTKVGTDDTKT